MFVVEQILSNAGLREVEIPFPHENQLSEMGYLETGKISAWVRVPTQFFKLVGGGEWRV